MPRLPGSVRSFWQAASTMSATPLSLAIAQQQAERLDRPIDGLVRLDLEVLRREPLGESEEGEGEAKAATVSAGTGGERRDDGAAARSVEGRP